MSMDRQTLRGHILVLAATVSGIGGMGMVFDGAMHGSLIGISRGMPLLLMGLWWAGRELGRSMMATGSRRGQTRRDRRSLEQAHRTRARTPGTSRVTSRQ